MVSNRGGTAHMVSNKGGTAHMVSNRGGTAHMVSTTGGTAHMVYVQCIYIGISFFKSANKVHVSTKC